MKKRMMVACVVVLVGSTFAETFRRPCHDAPCRDRGSASAVSSEPATAGAVELKDGAEFAMRDVPKELIAHVKRGGSVRLILEENGTTGYQWETTYASNECAVAIEHLGADTSTGLCGAPGKAAFTVTKKAAVQAPVVVEFAYRRSWEKGEPAQRVRLVLHTIPGESAGMLAEERHDDRWLTGEVSASFVKKEGTYANEKH